MAKLDPRVDPMSHPPKGRDDFSVDRVDVPKSTKMAPLSREEERPALALEPLFESPAAAPPAGPPDEDDDAETRPLAPPAPAAAKITSQDPRYEPIEKLLDANDWKNIGRELGSMQDIGKLPPNLGLVAALAHNETAKDGDPEAVATAIRCMAALLGVAGDSPIARVLARRMLRKNPVRFRERKAPAARTSLIIVLLTLVGGAGVGWAASIGSWRGILNALTP